MKPARRARVQVANPADGGFFYWLFKFYVMGACTLLTVGVGAVPAIYLAIANTVPAPPDVAAYDRQAELETRIYSADGQVLTTLRSKHVYLAQVAEIPPLLVQAFLAAEDRNFFQHSGVDLRGIARAALTNLGAGVVRQGGSTITQQVAKSFLSAERTIQRKARELVLARRLEARLTKEEILYLYVNQIYLGANAYGVKAAARVYFGKPLRKLSLGEMALLAGLARAPSRYSPRASAKRATRRRNQVLDMMARAQFISAARAAQAKKETIAIVTHSPDPMRWYAPHFTEHARRLLIKQHTKEKAYSAGWRVETTVDLPLQHTARQAALAGARAMDREQGWRGPLMKLRTKGQTEEFLARVKKLYDLRANRLRTDRPYPAVIDSVTAGRALGRVGERQIRIPLSLADWASPYSRVNYENGKTIESLRRALAPGYVVWVMAPHRWQRHKDWGVEAQGPTPMALHQVPRVEAAIYHFDHRTGYVLAMIGGLDYDRSTFNRTVQSCRQPGSMYKPVYYSLALNSTAWSMGSLLKDVAYIPEEGEVVPWSPVKTHGTRWLTKRGERNGTAWSEDGRVTMHMALARSLNRSSLNLMLDLGADKVKTWARRLGFTTPIYADEALALGASCIRTDESTRAFATFARGGTQIEPMYIRRIRDRYGRLVEDHTHAADPLISEGDRLDRLWALSTRRPPRVIDEKTAFLTNKLLRDSVRFGVASPCRRVPIPSAGKGGTSSDTMDVWYVGFTSQWIATAWIGDDNYRRPLGAKVISYKSVIPMWANYMKAAVGKRPGDAILARRPAGLRTINVDWVTGAPATAHTTRTVKYFYRPGSYRVPR